MAHSILTFLLPANRTALLLSFLLYVFLIFYVYIVFLFIPKEEDYDLVLSDIFSLQLYLLKISDPFPFILPFGVGYKEEKQFAARQIIMTFVRGWQELKSSMS